LGANVEWGGRWKEKKKRPPECSETVKEERKRREESGSGVMIGTATVDSTGARSCGRKTMSHRAYRKWWYRGGKERRKEVGCMKKIIFIGLGRYPMTVVDSKEVKDTTFGKTSLTEEGARKR